ncbi:MAG: hypothetical protein ACM3S1_04685 [Hyphomicrobiales bacterium]
MGRRRSRKQARRQAARETRFQDPGTLAEPSFEELLLLEQEQEEWDMYLRQPLRDALPMAPAKACGACREFIEAADGGRGTCLHPGSGVLSPWTDTPACDFFAQRSRREPSSDSGLTGIRAGWTARTSHASPTM